MKSWMTRSVAGFVVIGAGLFSGCAQQGAMKPSMPANEETVRLVRQSLTAADPNVLVGLVIAVLPDQRFAAVSDVDVKLFHEGEPITFIDSNKKFIANGVVKHITADALDVMYEKPMSMSASPKVGDLAVRFKS